MPGCNNSVCLSTARPISPLATQLFRRCKRALSVVHVPLSRPGGITMKSSVEIYDTPLRDGSQGEGINFSVADKLRIADKLDAFGIHYIEGGWPGSNPRDMEFFAQARRRRWRNAKIAAFSMTRRKGVAVEKD